MQKIEYIKIEKLKLHPRNPRRINKDQFRKLCESIKAHPDYFETRPILCNKDLIIFAGNMRYRAAKELGLKEVPCAIMDISEERQKEIMIRDNQENGEWDFDILGSDFKIDNLLKWGFDEKDLNYETNPKEKEIDENLETTNKCPKCGYEW